MDTPKFVAMLRIRNEARWIAQVVESLYPLCERLFILNDHSTDDTVSICERYDKVTLYHSEYDSLNEARDKVLLYQKIRDACSPKWILCIDGDEVLEPGGAEIIRQHVEEHPCHAYSFRILFLWDRVDQVRLDRVYSDFHRPSMFAPDHPRGAHGVEWLSTPFGRSRNGEEPNLHCSSVPQFYLHAHERCPVSLLHYGYLNRADRVRKLDYYTSIDWLNQAEDCYRHMVAGDRVSIDELPLTRRLINKGRITEADVRYMINTTADTRMLHAGPLDLQPLFQVIPGISSADVGNSRNGNVELSSDNLLRSS
jgi:glycosyltransferase involved in cell wall biosynthesis